MKPASIVFTAIIFSVLASLITVKVVLPVSVSKDKKESAYERVIRTGTLRCGYGISPPQLSKDVNTNQLSGSDYDIWEAIGKQLGLKIEWAEEAGWGNFIEGLRASRYDAFCSQLWPDYARSKFLSLSMPVAYSSLQTYVRSDDNRFDGHFERLNQLDVTIPVVDGDVSVMMVETNFPKAKKLTLPQTATVSDLFLSIKTKKADAMFFTPSMFAVFEKENQGKLRRVKNIAPAFLMTSYYGFDANEVQLRDMVNIALRGLIDSGQLKKIIQKHSSEDIAPLKNMGARE